MDHANELDPTVLGVPIGPKVDFGIDCVDPARGRLIRRRIPSVDHTRFIVGARYARKKSTGFIGKAIDQVSKQLREHRRWDHEHDPRLPPPKKSSAVSMRVLACRHASSLCSRRF
jgi:hypothetical protein